MTDSISEYDRERQKMHARAAAGSTHARGDTPISDERLRALLRPMVADLVPSIRQYATTSLFELREMVKEQQARIEALEQRLRSDRSGF